VARRVDGRLVIAAMVVIGTVFVLLNVFLGGGPNGIRELSDPRSSPADRGVSYPINLLSRCTPAVDFDGSYWAPTGATTMQRPTEPASVTLVSGRRAVLELATGRRIVLERLGTTIRLAACPAPTP